MRFSMIDVAKHQLELRKGAKNKLLTLTNEVKIITSSDDTFKLWQEVISCAARGDLIDVDSKELTKFKDHKNFEPEKDGVLTREFFKFLGNLSEADHAKLCRHILNRSGPSRKLPHPKVVVKQPTTVVEDCYSVKEWIEHRKKKATARFQLHLIRPELGLYTDGNKHFVQTAWKNFKKQFSITKASMRMLLDWGPTDLYYTNQRQIQHRNTPCEDLSPYTKQFFTVFLEQREQFTPPDGEFYFSAFKSNLLTFSSFVFDSWSTMGRDGKLGVIDFRCIPGVHSRSTASVDKLYFEAFMKLMSKHGKPMLTDLLAWLFICGDDDAYPQVEAFLQTPSVVEKFNLYPSEYIPAPFERLRGYSVKSKLATSNVRLLFLINNEMEHPSAVKKQYQVPQHVVYEKPRKYNELEYLMYPIKLQMEFYIRILDMFCEQGDSVFELYAGTKLMVASLVSVTLAFSSDRAKPFGHAILVFQLV